MTKGSDGCVSYKLADSVRAVLTVVVVAVRPPGPSVVRAKSHAWCRVWLQNHG